MSDNGPYTQPPQYPGGEGNSGGQPGPYGGAYGQGGQPDPGTGGQPGYPSGPYQQPPYGDPGTGGQQPPGYGTGPYPGQGGPQYHQANQPPGYPNQGYSAPPPPPPGKSNAGLWVVIAGGVVIVLLVVAVVVVLFNRGGSAPQAGGTGTQTTQENQEGGNEEPAGDPAEEPAEEPAGPSGGAPYAPPEDPCAVLGDSTLSQFGATDGSKTITDNSSSCSWSTEVNGFYGTLRVDYSTPYGGSDSVEAAKEDYTFNYDYATDEEGSIFDLKVVEEQQLDYGSESVLVFAEEEIIGPGNRTTVLIRQDNINITAEWSVSNFDSSSHPQSFGDVEDIMKQVGQEALSAL
ncbi:hypothetical protein NI17_002055 [Thermobifida halotolerans]|uniref:Uncharacterized protein n=1 Tax=Thermobifida halotolerans TaxID=483545 RepID=A0A399G5G9_9ACTN|nr:hypothetical protein [Thermobifida halotolerans]UOE20061.1 hypothetical protein NI17_002055 [Thermobifida halotolerans]